VSILRSAVDEAVAHPSELGYSVANLGDTGFFFTDYNLWQRDGRVNELIRSSAVPDLARSLVDSLGITLYFDNVFVKAAGSRNIVPWHEDSMYMRMNGTVLNFWIALDPVPMDSAVLFKRGSHLRNAPKSQAIHFDQAKTYSNPLTRGRAPLDDFSSIDDTYDIISWAAEPGDAVVFTQRTFHASLPNNAPHTRRAIGFLLLADDVTFDDDPGRSDPPFRGEDLFNGGPPQCASFPRLR
jgi:ectoine hydroxylase-related dioxygenase (phytanoyl-CoA dioxygenase family)